MEMTYKQVIDGVKIPIDQAKVIFNMCEMVYKTLTPQGTITQEQIFVYEELKKILNQIV